MYAIIQTRTKTHEPTHGFGIASKTKGLTNNSGTLDSIKYNDLATALKELMKSEFEENHIGFFLILE